MKFHILTTKQLKFTLFNIVCFILLNILLFTCQKDDFEREEQNNSSKYPDIHSQILSLDQVQQNSKLQKSLKKISHSFDVNKPKTKNTASNSTLETYSRIDSNDGSFSILTEEIMHVSSDNGDAYSFKIETPLLAEATFENFVITDDGEDIKFYIYSYITFEYNEETRHFLISLLPIEDDVIDVIDFQGLMNAKMHLINGCLYNIPDAGGEPQVIWCFGGGGEGSIPISSGGGEFGTVYFSNDCNGTCSEWIILHLNDGNTYSNGVSYPCEPNDSCINNGENNGGNNGENNGESGENNEEGSGQFPEGGGGGSVGGGSEPTKEPTVGALPVDQVTKTPKEEVLECLNENNLTPEQLQWLNSTANNIAIKGMATMIKKAGCEAMINIILDYINASPPNNQDFIDYADEQLECYGIQELMNSVYFTSAINNLRSLAPGASSEKGYEISRNSIGNISQNFVDGSSGFVTLRHGGEIIGGMHIHHDPGELMFSAQDIYNLYQYHTGNEVNNPNQFSSYEVFTVLVTIHGTYMLKMKDKNLLGYIFQNLTFNDLNGKLGHYYNLPSSSINEDDRFIKGLLKTFEYYRGKLNNMPRVPINFYKLDESTQKFDRLTLNNSGTIIKTPCN